MARVMGLAKPEDGLDRAFRSKRTDDGFRITWSAKSERRELTGEAEFEHGRPRRVETHERFTRQSMWGPGRRILKTIQVFKLKGR
jgi:hypothetical protein